LIKNVFSEFWISRISSGIEKNKANPSPRAIIEGSGDDLFFQDLWNWQKVEDFRGIIFESPAASLAAQLMATKETVFYHEHVLDRARNCQKETIWHHDQPYFPVDGDQNVSLWIPLDSVPKECGMRLVKGSHKWGKWFHPKKFSTKQNYPLIEDKDRHQFATSASAKILGRQYWDIPTDLDEDPSFRGFVRGSVLPSVCLALPTNREFKYIQEISDGSERIAS